MRRGCHAFQALSNTQSRKFFSAFLKESLAKNFNAPRLPCFFRRLAILKVESSFPLS
jgi:hypothetical protein